VAFQRLQEVRLYATEQYVRRRCEIEASHLQGIQPQGLKRLRWYTFPIILPQFAGRDGYRYIPLHLYHGAMAQSAFEIAAMSETTVEIDVEPPNARASDSQTMGVQHGWPTFSVEVKRRNVVEVQ